MKNEKGRKSTIEQEVDNLNNFWVLLPDDNYPKIPGTPEIKSGELREKILRDGEIDCLIREPKDSNYSEKLRRQTWRNFFAEIDRLVEEFGLTDQIRVCFAKFHDPERIRQTKKSHEIPLGDIRIPLEERLRALEERNKCKWDPHEVSKIVLPVFRKLLKIGYSRRDLF